jgi:hypothetical protein
MSRSANDRPPLALDSTRSSSPAGNRSPRSPRDMAASSPPDLTQSASPPQKSPSFRRVKGHLRDVSVSSDPSDEPQNHGSQSLLESVVEDNGDPSESDSRTASTSEPNPTPPPPSPRGTVEATQSDGMSTRVPSDSPTQSPRSAAADSTTTETANSSDEVLNGHFATANTKIDDPHVDAVLPSAELPPSSQDLPETELKNDSPAKPTDETPSSPLATDDSNQRPPAQPISSTQAPTIKPPPVSPRPTGDRTITNSPKQTISRPPPPPKKVPITRSVSVSDKGSPRSDEKANIEEGQEQEVKSTSSRDPPVRQKSAKDLVSFFNKQIVSAQSASVSPKAKGHERSPSNPVSPARSKIFKRPTKTPDSSSAEESK